MTTSTATPDEWAAHPLGKVSRVLFAVAGLATATLVLLLAVTGGEAIWLMMLLAVSLAGTTVRAAIEPSVVRLATVGVVMAAFPFVGQII